MLSLDSIQAAAAALFDKISASGNHLTPAAVLQINGRPFGSHAVSRIISVQLADNRGFEADELTIELDDSDGLLAIPPLESKIKCWLGYAETGVVYKGEYKMSEFSHSGAPDKLSITARAADLADSLAEQQEKSWHKQTLYAVVEQIAKRHGYDYRIGEDYRQTQIAHIDQTSESDASFLTRLADLYDAIATVKNGILLFMPKGQAVTAGGQPVPPVLLTRMSGDGHSFAYSNTEAYNAVRACYIDKKSGKKKRSSSIKTTSSPSKPLKPPPANTKPSAKTAKPTKSPPKPSASPKSYPPTASRSKPCAISMPARPPPKTAPAPPLSASSAAPPNLKSTSPPAAQTSTRKPPSRSAASSPKSTPKTG